MIVLANGLCRGGRLAAGSWLAVGVNEEGGSAATWSPEVCDCVFRSMNAIAGALTAHATGLGDWGNGLCACAVVVDMTL